MSALATISAATRYAFTQNGGVALEGRLGYVYLSPEGKVKTSSDYTNVTYCYGGDLITYRDMFPAYHTANIADAQKKAVKLLKGK